MGLGKAYAIQAQHNARGGLGRAGPMTRGSDARAPLGERKMSLDAVA